MIKDKKLPYTRLVLLSLASKPMSGGEIQRMIFEDRTGRKWTKKDRGYWCSQLYGTHMQPGLLKRYCTKLPDGRYFLTENWDKGPYFTKKNKTKTQLFNERLAKAEYLLKLSEHECPDCGAQSLHLKKGLPHFTHESGNYKIDCQNHVYTDLLELTDLKGDDISRLKLNLFFNGRHWTEVDEKVSQLVKSHVME